MRTFNIDEYVILLKDMPEYELRNGDIGVVRNPVFKPELAYEVDFYPTRPRRQTHAVISPEDMDLQPPAHDVDQPSTNENDFGIAP